MVTHVMVTVLKFCRLTRCSASRGLSETAELLVTRATLASTGTRRRVSVCLSVRLSHAGIVSKRLNVGSRKQRHQ